MACKRCGQCCVTADMNLNEPEEDESELARWLFYHRCQPVKMKRGDGFVLAVRIPLVCVNLESIDGVYHCKIYDERPKICKEYMCGRAKE